MPVRRHRLRVAGEGCDILTAWVSVPDLKLYAYRQRYEFVRSERWGSIVRFIDRGLTAGFRADLVLDEDGLIETYPGLAHRLDGRDGPGHS